MKLAVAVLTLVALVGCSAKALDLGGQSPEGGGGGGTSEGPSSGSDGGPAIIASLIQETPENLVSDGTSLFWVSGVGPGGAVSSMPVGGGPIATVVPAPVPGGFLFVDDVNVYFPSPGPSAGIARAPKGGGGTPTLVNEAGAEVGSVTALGPTVYWTEIEQGHPPNVGGLLVKSAPLTGGAISTIGGFNFFGQPIGGGIAVTATTVFLSEQATPLSSFLISGGIPEGGMPAPVPGGMQGCQQLLSDTDAVYCYGPSLTRVANDGSMTVLGTVVDQGQTGGALAIDDAYVYWLDIDTVGTIMRVPRTGGTATIIARDTSPVAIAVDAHAVYWSDSGGNIIRLAK